MKFELTISGMCVIALKTSDASDHKPAHPEAIDIIIPAGHGGLHKCLLSYDPAQLNPNEDFPVEPRLVIDSAGGRIASLDVSNLALTFDFAKNPASRFTVHWGEDAEQPAAPWQETSLNWIPKLEDLGFKGFPIGEPGTLPANTAARITLPFGALASRSVVTRPDTKEYIVWEFPANGVKRVLTNEVTFIADQVEDLIIRDAEKNSILTGSADTLRMCISNDMTVVPLDYNSGDNVLKHLSHLSHLAGGEFKEPYIVEQETRTGHPICMGVVYIWGPGSGGEDHVHA